MANTKKLIQAAAGAAGGEALNVEDVFSTYLYEGNGSTQTITNGIDLSGEGGLVWIKDRTGAYSHNLADTERGYNQYLFTDSAQAQYDAGSLRISSFNSNGFSLGSGSNGTNRNANDHTSWTFRKAPKFFDVVTYSGSASSQSIAHNLGSTPGLIITKKLDSSGNWAVYHRSLGATKYILLNSTNAANTGSTFWNDTEPTSTHFTVGTNDATNNSVRDYVAYLFAHNNGDGEFGPDADQDIIKCGSYTGTGSAGLEVDLGFEPQWLLIKNASRSISWHMTDVMRGLNHTGRSELYANTSGAEWTGSPAIVSPTSTGFVLGASNTYTNYSGENHIYIAIRRGPMAVPESATDVFDIATRDGTTFNGPDPDFSANHLVDFALYKDNINTTGNWVASSRLQQGVRLIPNTTDAEASSSFYAFDYMSGWGNSGNSADTNDYAWMWKRAPNYFDVVAYTGNSNGSTPTQTLTHNLGVKPEMMWVKSRGSSQNWYVFHKDVWDATNNYYLRLNSTAQASASDGSIFPSDVTDTQFTVSERWEVNQSGVAYIAYLFASVDGVSKVGSFTYTQGVAQNIDCGFSSGARFVLYKRTSGTSGWTVFDTERGIVAGNDPMLFLNTTSAEDSNYDFIDPYSGGFALSDSTANLSGDYIFYAIA